MKARQLFCQSIAAMRKYKVGVKHVFFWIYIFQSNFNNNEQNITLTATHEIFKNSEIYKHTKYNVNKYTVHMLKTNQETNL